jgi:hypothetical protein
MSSNAPADIRTAVASAMLESPPALVAQRGRKGNGGDNAFNSLPRRRTGSVIIAAVQQPLLSSPAQAGDPVNTDCPWIPDAPLPACAGTGFAGHDSLRGSQIARTPQHISQESRPGKNRAPE